MVDFSNPMLWAVLIGWILTVVLHEFGHGIVGYWGGDYTIKEKGGLTLNPLQYIHPLTSLVLPAIFLLMGGIPLPGGATYIRHDLLRGRIWEVWVALAGPAMTFLIFLGFALPLHPAFGWIDPTSRPIDWNNAQIFCGAMAVLEFYALLINLLPIPPLDGFHAVAPFLRADLRERLESPQVSMTLFIILFMALSRSPRVQTAIFQLLYETLSGMGFGLNWTVFPRAFSLALWSHS